MQLKDYQQTSLDQLDLWLKTLQGTKQEIDHLANKGQESVLAHIQNYPKLAWEDLATKGVLPSIAASVDTHNYPYITRTAANKKPIPHVCMKIPTGGGKTLLGTAALEKLTLGTGFVLWIVPSKAIYQQTLKAFRTREHPYRQLLERISSGRVKLLEKPDQFSRQDIENYLCIMMLMLPSANRQKGREFLKIFRDSGNYTSFFPEQDDLKGNLNLIKEYDDLEKLSDDSGVKQSLINVLKLIHPCVILDEAHKAYGKNDKANNEFVRSINHLNPRLVLELSATPKSSISNILVDISGQELKDEEMIKLPIEIHNFSNSDWKRTLAETQEKLEQLTADAENLQQHEGRYIRPIALIRVQRTGKDQTDSKFLHAEKVREYLIQKLSVPEAAIRVQSSESKELANEDLLSELSPVQWIITKDALKEGWDCSFAYILALLDNTKAQTAITQMVGRVMRQPNASLFDSKFEALNRCYIYCYNEEVSETVEWVKLGLEQEGLTGLTNAVIGSSGSTVVQPEIIERRSEYKKLDICLPQVLYADKSEKNGWRHIDYYSDILGNLDWDSFDLGKAVNLKDPKIIAEATATSRYFG